MSEKDDKQPTNHFPSDDDGSLPVAVSEGVTTGQSEVDWPGILEEIAGRIRLEGWLRLLTGSPPLSAPTMEFVVAYVERKFASQSPSLPHSPSAPQQVVPTQVASPEADVSSGFGDVVKPEGTAPLLEPPASAPEVAPVSPATAGTFKLREGSADVSFASEPPAPAAEGSAEVQGGEAGFTDAENRFFAERPRTAETTTYHDGYDGQRRWLSRHGKAMVLLTVLAVFLCLDVLAVWFCWGWWRSWAEEAEQRQFTECAAVISAQTGENRAGAERHCRKVYSGLFK